MPKANLVSLPLLSFHEALKAIINVDPDKVGIIPKRLKNHEVALTKKKPKQT